MPSGSICKLPVWDSPGDNSDRGDDELPDEDEARGIKSGGRSTGSKPRPNDEGRREATSIGRMVPASALTDKKRTGGWTSV